MKVIYIAGPFRGETAWAIECNVRKAEELALEVAHNGAMPLCPHTNSRFFDGQCTGQFWLDGTLELLKRCDAIIMLPTWDRSKGAMAEHEWASTNGVPIFYNIDELFGWLLGSKAKETG